MTKRLPPNMTRLEFCGALALLRWSASAVAVWCGYSRQSGPAWEKGRCAVPAPVVAWLDARIAGDLADPPARTPKADRAAASSSSIHNDYSAAV